MPNVNQVKFGDTMIMDISDTTASPEDVNEGEIFYMANGARSVGTGGYTLPIASENRLGGIKVGRNLSIDNNSGVLDATNTEYSEGDGININETTISLDIDYLTASRLGVIPSSEKGTNNGVATLNENSKIPNVQLPIASENNLGGIKVGNNLSIDANGVLNATGGGTTYTAGDGIDIENTTISLDINYLTASRLNVISASEKGAIDGVATLNNGGKIPNSQLPSNVTKYQELTQAQYNALTPEQKTNGTTYFLTDASSGSGSEINYSTEEQAIGTWIDGKTLYQKTFYIAVIVGGDNNVSFGTTIDQIVSIDGVAKDETRGTYKVIPYPNTSPSTWAAYFDHISSTSFDISCGSGYSGSNRLKDVYVTARYTK